MLEKLHGQQTNTEHECADAGRKKYAEKNKTKTNAPDEVHRQKIPSFPLDFGIENATQRLKH